MKSTVTESSCNHIRICTLLVSMCQTHYCKLHDVYSHCDPCRVLAQYVDGRPPQVFLQRWEHRRFELYKKRRGSNSRNGADCSWSSATFVGCAPDGVSITKIVCSVT
jgi:hypothetical protein